MATLFCDESGFSGPNLYHDSAVYFTYAGVVIEPDEAEAALAEFKRRIGHTQGEVKFSSALKRPKGVETLEWLLAEHGHRAKVWFACKKYATAGKFFEYVFEPILTENNYIFYKHDFHRFIANMLVAGMFSDDCLADELLADAQKMVHTRDASGLKRLLGSPGPGKLGEDVYDDIATIALGYRDRVLEEVDILAQMGDAGVWTMDLTITAFGMVIRAHAANNPQLTVFCDDSKPLKAGLDIATRIAQADFGAALGPLGWSAGERATLNEPITLVKASQKMPGVQLADLFAGMTREVLTNSQSEHGQRWWQPVLGTVVLPSSMLHDFDYINPDRPMPRVNAIVLKELAARAHRGDDPVAGMPMFYELAKWQEGVYAVG